VVCLLLSFSLYLSASPSVVRVSGKILDPRGVPVTGALAKLLNSAGGVIREAKSDEQGNFILDGIEPGEYHLRAEEPTFVSVTLDVSVARGQQTLVTVQFRQLVSVSQSITFVASAPSLLTPDPAQSIVIHDQVLDANPGRPGAPISIPGLPIETASGGIKAPQYFAPGVAGDHGEPIAQFFQIGIFSIRTICLRMPTGTATPIRITSFHRQLKPSQWTGGPSMFGKETTLSISQRPTFQGNGSIASSR